MTVKSKTVGVGYWIGEKLAAVYYAVWCLGFHLWMWELFGYSIYWRPTDLISGIIGVGIAVVLLIPAMIAGIICGAAWYYGLKLLISVIRG